MWLIASTDLSTSKMANKDQKEKWILRISGQNLKKSVKNICIIEIKALSLPKIS